MTIHQSESNGVTVLTPEVPELAYTNTTDFKNTVYAIIDKGANRLVMDLQHVGFIDSTGVGALISIRGRLIQNNGAMALCNFKRDVKQLMDVTSLHKVFEIYDSVDKAVIGVAVQRVQNAHTFDFRDGALWLILEGEVTMENIPPMKKAMDKALAKNDYKAVVIDLARVTFMDSSGISFLVLVHKRTREQDKYMYLLAPSVEVVKVLDLVGLSKLFSIHPDEKSLKQKL